MLCKEHSLLGEVVMAGFKLKVFNLLSCLNDCVKELSAVLPQRMDMY